MIERLRMMRPLTLLLGVLVLWCADASVASAQTQDDFFNDAVLQEVRIVMSSRDWQTLKAHAADNTYYAADLTWNGVTVRNIGIRSRGSATRNGIKPGLRVDINRYISNQEFLGLKAFSLDNMYSDSSLVRESVTMKMFERMKLPASREAHARVYVNNEYVGAYVLIEAIDRTFVERLFGTEEANVESGGYLFEYQWMSPYHLEYLGPDLEAYAAIFKPQTRDTDSIANIYAPLEEMIRTINESTDDDFAAAVGKHLDLGLFMKYLAVESFMVEWDGLVGFAGMNNFNLYRFRNGLSQFIPKDKDASLASLEDSITFRMDTNVLVRRALLVPALREAYLNALRACVALAGEPTADDSRGWLEREVERQATLVTPAIAEDPVFPYSFDEFLAVTDSLIHFAQRRAPYVDCQVTQMDEGLAEDVDPAAACSGVIQQAARRSR
jgi:spore coat protein H